MFVLIHRGLHRVEAPKPRCVRPWRRLGLPSPTEMNNRERIARCSKDHGVTALALRYCCQGKTVQFMARSDLNSCFPLERPSVLAFCSKPGLAEVG
jgi:hypothetical protein